MEVIENIENVAEDSPRRRRTLPIDVFELREVEVKKNFRLDKNLIRYLMEFLIVTAKFTQPQTKNIKFFTDKLTLNEMSSQLSTIRYVLPIQYKLWKLNLITTH